MVSVMDIHYYTQKKDKTLSIQNQNTKQPKRYSCLYRVRIVYVHIQIKFVLFFNAFFFPFIAPQILQMRTVHFISFLLRCLIACKQQLIESSVSCTLNSVIPNVSLNLETLFWEWKIRKGPIKLYLAEPLCMTILYLCCSMTIYNMNITHKSLRSVPKKGLYIVVRDVDFDVKGKWKLAVAGL